MARLTFERILLIYMAIAALLALLTPTGFAVEDYAPINPSYVPFAGWLRRTPNALPYLTTYFFSLSLLTCWVFSDHRLVEDGSVG